MGKEHEEGVYRKRNINEKCSSSIIMKNIQFKVRYFSPIRLTKIKKFDSIQCG